MPWPRTPPQKKEDPVWLELGAPGYKSHTLPLRNAGPLGLQALACPKKSCLSLLKSMCEKDKMLNNNNVFYSINELEVHEGLCRSTGYNYESWPTQESHVYKKKKIS